MESASSRFSLVPYCDASEEFPPVLLPPTLRLLRFRPCWTLSRKSLVHKWVWKIFRTRKAKDKPPRPELETLISRPVTMISSSFRIPFYTGLVVH